MIASYLQYINAAGSAAREATEEVVFRALLIEDSDEALAEIMQQGLTATHRIYVKASCPGITKGAQDAILAAEDVKQLAGIIFNDKGFKEKFRAYGRKNHLEQEVNVAINAGLRFAFGNARLLGRSLPESSLESDDNSIEAVRPIDKINVSGSHPFLSATSLSQFWAEPIAFKARLSEGSVSYMVGDLIEMLCDPKMKSIRSDILSSIAASQNSIIVILLFRILSSSVNFLFDDDLIYKIKITAVRVYIAMNASESAYRIVAELMNGLYYQRLPDNEKLRVRFLRARAALRTGRRDEGNAEYFDIFLEHPRRLDAALQYMTSISTTNPALSSAMGAYLIDKFPNLSPSDKTYLGEICVSNGDFPRALNAFMSSMGPDKIGVESYLGLSNLSLAQSNRADWYRYFSVYANIKGMPLSRYEISDVPAPFWFQADEIESVRDHPKVAVVMTTFNAASTLGLALESVIRQTLKNIEIWVVDDCSEDNSHAIALQYAQRDDRIRALINTNNCGTYSSKNRALKLTDAEFVSLHDSDDWMHPMKLETHLKATVAGACCTTSDWVRMDAMGKTIVRRGGGYSHLNPASTFLARATAEKVGFFDEVRTGADGEFVSRLRAAFGQRSVEHLDRTLAIGLHHEASLTTSGMTAFDEHRYSPVRLAYTEAWLEWQISQIECGAIVRLDVATRGYDVPDAIRVER